METTTPATEPPIASQQAPDFREPWDASAEYVYGRDDKEVHLYPHRLRIAQCVNACAGMADPAKEITHLKDYAGRTHELAMQVSTVVVQREAKQEELEVMREALQSIESDARDLRKFKKFPESVESLACSILLKLKSTTP